MAVEDLKLTHEPYGDINRITNKSLLNLRRLTLQTDLNAHLKELEKVKDGIKFLLFIFLTNVLVLCLSTHTTLGVTLGGIVAGLLIVQIQGLQPCKRGIKTLQETLEKMETEK
jgi:hypothetical protein